MARIKKYDATTNSWKYADGVGESAEFVKYDKNKIYPTDTVGKELQDLNSKKISQPASTVPEGYVYKSNGSGSGSWQEESGGGANIFTAIYNDTSFNDIDEAVSNDIPVFLVHPDYKMTFVCTGYNTTTDSTNDSQYRFEGIIEDSGLHKIAYATVSSDDSWNFEIFCLDSEFINYDAESEYSDGSIGKELQDLNSQKISQPASTVPEGYVYKSNGSGSGSWQEESGGGSNVFVAVYGETTFEDIDTAYTNGIPIILIHPEHGVTCVCIGDKAIPEVTNSNILRATLKLYRFEGIVGEYGVHKIVYVTVDGGDNWTFGLTDLDAESVIFDDSLIYSNGTVGQEIKNLYSQKISQPASTVPEGYVYKSNGSGSGSWQEESGGGGSTAEDISYDPEEEYSEGTIGNELKSQYNDITSIKDIIPEDATSENQLADKEWVESIVIDAMEGVY